MVENKEQKTVGAKHSGGQRLVIALIFLSECFAPLSRLILLFFIHFTNRLGLLEERKMSNAILFQQVVEYVESLSTQEQDLLFELIHKRRIEQRRSEIARNYSETLEAMKAGKAKIGTVADLRADFNNLDEEELE